MANSKFSGVGFTSGVTATDNSVFAGYEVIGPGQGENRRWTSKELFTGTYNLNGGGLEFFFTQNQRCKFNADGPTATGTCSIIATKDVVVNADTASTGQNISLRVGGSEKMSVTGSVTFNKQPVTFDSGISDVNNQMGTSGQVLSSTGSGIEWINAGGSTPTLSAVMGQGASYSGSNSVLIQPSSQIIINAGGTNQQLTLGSSGAKNLIGSGQINVGGLSSELLFLGAKDFHFNNYQGSLAPNGNRMRFTAGGNIEVKTGNPGTSTAGGNIIVEPKGGSLTLRTVDGSASGTSYPGGNVTIGSSSGIVAITSEIELQAVVKATNLPTSDPGVSGQLWNDGGTLKISP